MKIENIKIQNFRSLKNVKLEDIGELCILIGANSSGKSNFLEALHLFFSEIDSQNSKKKMSDYLWFDRESDKPIIFTISIKLDKNEATQLIPQPLHNILEIKNENVITITREIIGPHSSAYWTTSYVKFNDTEIIKDGKIVLPESKISTIQTEEQQSLTQDQLLRLILQSLSQSLKDKFKMIFATRNSMETSSKVGKRVSIIPSDILYEISNLGTSLDRERELELKWAKLESNIKQVTSVEDIRVLSGNILLKELERDIRIPLHLIGGGYQEVIGLLYQLNVDDNTIFGIEEPEIHLHPTVARRFFKKLKEISSRNQTFIVTHSTLFVDLAELKNIWFVTKRNGESIIRRCTSREELKEILYELGVRPSDIFFANGIIFVEGETEKVFFPIIAKKLGLDFEKVGLNIIPIYGKSRGKYHLSVWVEAAKTTNIPFFMILDKDASNEAEEYTRRYGEIQDKLFILSRGSLEEYYPRKLLFSGLEKILDIKLTEEDKKKFDESSIAENLKKLLKKKRIDRANYIKVELGRYVAENISINEIDEEIKRIIGRIFHSLR